MVDAFLYFSLVLLIEHGVITKLWHLVSKMWMKVEDEIVEDDEDILAEIEAVKKFQTTRGLLCVVIWIMFNSNLLIQVVLYRMFKKNKTHKSWLLDWKNNRILFISSKKYINTKSFYKILNLKLQLKTSIMNFKDSKIHSTKIFNFSGALLIWSSWTISLQI